MAWGTLGSRRRIFRWPKRQKEAAALLNLSLYTVETRRPHILQKLHLHSTAELALYAVRKGIMS